MKKLESPLFVGKPMVADEAAFQQRVAAILESKWFSNDGPFVREFEAAIESYLGVRHAIAVCNATLGLELAARAVGMHGQVAVPSYSFVATAHALRWQGIDPVFIDIDPVTHNMCPRALRDAMSSRLSGIIATHVWGRPCDTEALGEIAANAGIPIMYDAAHAFGCGQGGQMIGQFGACEVFSFHATKFLNSFEGGCITTNSCELAERLRFMRNFGFSGVDQVDHLGTNAKMPEVCAAMGLTNLTGGNRLIAANSERLKIYENAFAGNDLARVLVGNGEPSNCQYIVIEMAPHFTLEDRDSVVAELVDKNVIARKYFWPSIHRMAPYRDEQPQSRLALHHTESIADRVIVMPNGLQMSTEICVEVAVYVKSLIEILGSRRRG